MEKCKKAFSVSAAGNSACEPSAWCADCADEWCACYGAQSQVSRLGRETGPQQKVVTFARPADSRLKCYHFV